MTASGSRATTPLVAATTALPPAAILAYLARQRWFAAKGRGASTSANVTGVVPLSWGDGALAIARVAVTAQEREQIYQLPIAVRPATTKSAGAGSPIATVTVSGEAFAVFDATDDRTFLSGLARSLAGGCVAEGDHGLRWIVEPEEGRRLVVPEDAEIRVSSAEQSNTSIVFAREAILKLFRRIEPGIHPEVEVGRFLTGAAGFAGAPAVVATLWLEEGQSRAAAGIVQRYLAGAGNAWDYAMARGGPYFKAARSLEPTNEFLSDVAALGALTREMHDALASDGRNPSFAPERAAAEDLDRWAHRARQMIRDALALLERQLTSPTIPRDRLAEAAILVKRRERYLDWVNELADSLGDDLGARIRVHGDYHLGQVLRTVDNRFVVIDFEGEPTRSLEERREKTSPLRDVAGMLRSFAYAAAVLGASIEKSADIATRELRSARWERDTRATFLDAYLRGHEPSPGLLPDEEAHARQLIALFETEKVFYELAYELDHRPDWAWIPMRGISKLLVK